MKKRVNREQTQASKQNRDRKNLITLLLFVAAILALCCIGFLISKSKEFVYEDCLDEVVVTVDQQSVTLQEFGYYIISVESFVNKQAVLYNGKNPLEYWNKHFSAGLQSTFVSSYAEKTAYEVCICDLVYEQMAKDKGLELDEKGKEKAQILAEEFWKKCSKEQLEKTKLTKEQVEQISQKKVLIANFAKEYVKEVHFDGYKGYREDLLSYDGDYYKKELKPKHSIKINSKIKEGLKFGRITLNQ